MDRSSEEIIEQARREIAARQVLAVEERGVRELPWRYAFLGLLVALVVGLLAWPSLPPPGWGGTATGWNMYAVVHGVCAQIHNVELGGAQLPLCARNTGIYSGFLITTLYLLALGRVRAARLPPWPVTGALVVLIAVMAVDGFNSMLRDMFLPHLYTPRNELRTLTGIGMGVSLGVLMLLILNVALRGNPDTEQRVLRGWGELIGALALGLLVQAAIYTNFSAAYWPIAILAWAGIVGILFCVNLLLVGLVMRYEGTVTRLSQLARPATVALLITLAMLWAMSSARFWLEGQGLVF